MYLLPATDNGYAYDLMPGEAGFQGQITLTVQTGIDEQYSIAVDIEPGLSGTGADAIGQGDGLDVLRAQQRLNYLGFRKINGLELELTNVFDQDTQDAVRRFNAAVDAAGTTPVPDEDATLNLDTVSWLSATTAPHWVTMPGMTAGQRYGTSWLIDALSDVVNDPSLDIEVSDIDSISTSDGWTANWNRPLNIGRGHQAGMEVDFAVPAGAEQGDDGSLSADEQWLVDLVTSLHDAAADYGLVLIDVGCKNADVRAAIEALYPGVTSDASESEQVIHIGFAAPAVPDVLSPEQQAMLLGAAGGLEQVGEDSETYSWLGWLLPMTDEDESVAEGEGLVPSGGGSMVSTAAGSPSTSQPTLGSMLHIGQSLHDTIYQPIADYFATANPPTIDGLTGALAGWLGVTAQSSADGLSLSFHYDQSDLSVLAFDLGDDLTSLGLSDYGISLDASGQIDATVTFGCDVTLGFDTSHGSGAAAAYIQVQDLTFGAELSASNMNFAANVGFLGADVVDGTFQMDIDIAAQLNSGNRLYVSDLASRPITDLLVLTPVGSMSVNLPIRASIGDWSTDDIAGSPPAILITDTDLFDSTSPDVDFALPESLSAFTRLTPAAVVGVLKEYADWLSDFQASSVLGTPMPFADGRTLGQVLGLDTTFLDEIITNLETQPNTPGFSTAQELLASIPGISAVHYDPDYAATGALAQAGEFGTMGTSSLPMLDYTFDLSALVDPLVLPASLDLLGDSALAHLAGITVSPSSVVNIQPDVNMALRIGFDLSAPGASVPIDTATALADLPGWKDGLLTSDGLSDITITLRDGSSLAVNFDGLGASSTLGDVLVRLNTANPAKFEAQLDATAKRFLLRDKTTTPAADPEFKIVAANNSLAGFMLGVLGVDDNADGTIAGTPLHGDSLENHVYLFTDESGLSASLNLTATDIDALASFGMLGLGLDNASGAIGANFDVSLNPLSPSGVAASAPTPAGNVVSLMTLINSLDNVGDLVNINASGAAEFNLPVSLKSSFPGLTVDPAANPTITVSWPEVFSVDSLTGAVGPNLSGLDVTFHDFDDLIGFQDLSSANVLDLLVSAAGVVSDIAGYDFMAVKMPVINRSLSELLDFASDFADRVSAFQAQPGLAVEALESALERRSAWTRPH